MQLQDGRVIELEITSSPSGLRKPWNNLASAGIATVFQDHTWITNWCTHAAPQTGEEPIFIVGWDREPLPAFIFPLARRKVSGLTVLSWLGQKYAGLNMGLYRSDIANQLTRSDLLAVFRAVNDAGHNFRAVHFHNQPEAWDGIANPILQLGKQRSPNQTFARRLQPDFDDLYKTTFSRRSRKNHRRHRRKLAEYGELEVIFAEDVAARREILTTFFAQKSRQLAVVNSPNPFANEGLQAFYDSLLSENFQSQSEMSFCGLTINGEIVATLIGFGQRRRFHLTMSSIKIGEISRWSPGQPILETQIESLCRRGFTEYDFGPGDSPQKRRWGMQPQQLFHTFAALDGLGYLTTARSRLRTYGLRKIKQNRSTYAIAQTMRARFGRRRS